MSIRTRVRLSPLTDIDRQILVLKKSFHLSKGNEETIRMHLADGWTLASHDISGIELDPPEVDGDY